MIRMQVITCNLKFIRVVIKLLLIFGPLTTLEYNVDTKYPLIYSHNGNFLKDFQRIPKEIGNNYFGYSILLYYYKNDNSSWLIVGAPKGSYDFFPHINASTLLDKPGVVYRCKLTNMCEIIEPNLIENEEAHIVHIDSNILIKKQNAWFGSALAIHKTIGLLTVCAPRTIITINPYRKMQVDTMHGMCYSGLFYQKLLIEDKNCLTYDFVSPFWYNPLHGFSVHYPSIQPSGVNRIIGEPKHELYGTVDIIHEFKKKKIDVLVNDELAQFGYSVTSGYFFDKNQLLYASGAPGWQYKGLVGIINPLLNMTMVANLTGNNIGEFFGASMAVGDLNNDGLDDLIVGAPHWGNDNGKVYLYLGNSNGGFHMATWIESEIDDAQFGYAITCGDLDGDQFSDIIVGAPWEDAGVVYIYNGGPKLNNTIKLYPLQRIEATTMFKNRIQRFGFSLSEPVDIDNNGYPDIAIGAYKSGHAIILRSKPIIKTYLTMSTIPNILERNTSTFLFKTCIKYHKVHLHTSMMNNTSAYFKVRILLDETYKRTSISSMEYPSNSSLLESCININITILHGIQNFIDPIILSAKYDIFCNATSTDLFDELCPMKSKDTKSNITHLMVPFNIECGEDKVCNSNISANVKFYGILNNNTWVIGSNDISLEANLQNHGEPAYLLSVIFVLPKGIALRSILPFCQEDKSNDNLTVICDVGNPFNKNEQKSVKLDLNMEHLSDDLLHGQIINFFTKIETLSFNSGVTKIITTLKLQSEASISVNGKPIEGSYYFANINHENSNVSFQHTYQILKFGATPISTTYLVIKIPIATEILDSLIHIYQPQLYVSGKYYDCISNDINLLSIHMTKFTRDILENQSNLTSPVLNQKLPQKIVQEFNGRYIRELFNNTRDTRKSEILETEKENTINMNKKTDLYLNCSTYGVKCSNVICDLSVLKTPQEIGRLSIKMILDLKKIKDNLLDLESILKLSTEAYIETKQPLTASISVNRFIIPVTTVFYIFPKEYKLDYWILLMSLSLGLILLCTLIIILRKLNFFKRRKKEELTAMKKNIEQPEIK